MGRKAAPKAGDLPSKLQVESGIPEELETVWDKEIETAFLALEPKQQNFLLAYLKEWNGAEAYRQAYNNLASNHVAAAGASRTLTNVNIGIILGKFANQKTEALFLVQKTLNEAAREATKPIFGKDDEGQPILVMEQPDYPVRVKAAEALAKLHGLNAADKVEHSGSINQVVKYHKPEREKDDQPAG